MCIIDGCKYIQNGFLGYKLKALYLSLAVVVLDQITKLLLKGVPFLNLTGFRGSKPVLGDFLRLTYVENPGMAFGYDAGGYFKLGISLFSLIASIGLVYYLYTVRKSNLSLRISLAFILGGAVGNLIDRTFYGIFYGYQSLFYGYVVDFIDVDFFKISVLGHNYDRFPVFNIADAAVTIGVFLLLIFYKKNQIVPEEALQGETAGASSEAGPGNDSAPGPSKKEPQQSEE